MGTQLALSKKRLRRERQACCAHHLHVTRPTGKVHQRLFNAQHCALPTVARRGSRLSGCAALRIFGANQKAKSVSIMRTRSAQIGVQSATIDVQLDGQIGSKKEGLQGDEGGRQDKRIVSVVSVFAADSGTCSADMEAEGHTNIRRQDRRNQGALFVSPSPTMTWRNL